MTVSVTMMQGGQSPVTSFTDQFNRADAITIGPDWIVLNLKTSAGAGNVSIGRSEITTNRGKFSCTGPVAPVQTLATAWTPKVLTNSIYSAQKVFVEVEFVSVVAGFVGGLWLHGNYENTGAITTPPYCDYYYLQFDGLIAKVMGGGAPVGFGGVGMAPVNGDIVRFEAENSGNTVILRQILNSVTLDTEIQDGALGDISQVGFNGVFIDGGTNAAGNGFTINRITVGSF